VGTIPRLTSLNGRALTSVYGSYKPCQNFLDKSLFGLIRDVTSIVADEWIRRRSQNPAQLVRFAGQGSENIQFNAATGANLLRFAV
jgi:hypothetical protein